MVEELKININDVSDEELITMILESGEMDLFSALYDRYGDKVFRKVISMIKDIETSKDLTQEILVKTFLSLAKFEGKAKFSTWLYMITYNYCIDHIRKQKRRQKSKTEFEYNEIETATIIDETDEKEVLEMQFDRLDSLLEMLPTEDKTLLLMYYQDEMSIKELQEYFDMGASAVKMRLSRARQKIRKMYLEIYSKS